MLNIIRTANSRKSVVKLYVEEFFNDWNSKVQRRDYDLKEIEVFDDADGFGKKDFTPPYASKNTFINNVSDLFHFVKTHDVDFNPNQTSVICNEDGTPMIMYHGTSSKFDVFDISNAESVPWYITIGSPFSFNIRLDGFGTKSLSKTLTNSNKSARLFVLLAVLAIELG